jgi:hypothetical protein
MEQCNSLVGGLSRRARACVPACVCVGSRTAALWEVCIVSTSTTTKELIFSNHRRFAARRRACAVPDDVFRSISEESFTALETIQFNSFQLVELVLYAFFLLTLFGLLNTSSSNVPDL